MVEPRPERLRLFDILHAIAVIEQITVRGGPDRLEEDAVYRFAVERALEIASEASRHLSAEMKVGAPEVEWRALADLGNILRHGYEALEPQRIWTDILVELPKLKAACERFYAQVKRPADPWPDAS